MRIFCLSKRRVALAMLTSGAALLIGAAPALGSPWWQIGSETAPDRLQRSW
jgi:hypothetical protein